MSLSVDRSRMLNCPQCGNHCPVGALKCGKGRKYFGVDDKEHGQKQDRRYPEDSLAGRLRRCGRFVRRSGLEEDELFRALSDEEKASLGALLGKLSAGWREQFGQDALDRHGKKHRKHHDH